MKKLIFILALAFGSISMCLTAQNSAPAPGSGNLRGPGGGNFSAPAPGTGGAFNPGPQNGIGWNPGPGYQGGWGSPWYSGGFGNNSLIINGSVNMGPNQNVGNVNVLACGYDATGVWRTIPLNVNYNYNGIQYNVEVVNAWNPWSDAWDYDVDVAAVNTSYLLRGTEFDFYVVLSTGTYYFNL